MEFYSPTAQRVAGPVVMLPQKGSASGGSKRPLNSFAVLREGRSVLFDAPYSWVLDGIQALADEGHPPAALVLSHRNTAGSGDAFEEIARRFGAPVLLHPADQGHPEARGTGVAFSDPTASPVLAEAGIEVVAIPGHTEGSIMLYLADEGGILLAGDSAVGPGPEQSDRTPRLERPVGADEDARFLDTWRDFVARLPLAAVLPLHGECYLRSETGEEAFEAILANIWRGEPMNPSRT